MKDEIKEILDKLKDGNWYNELDLTGEMWIELRWKETHLLLDYITNLQEEIQKKEAMYDSLAVSYRLEQEENERLKELDENYPIEEQLEEALKYENIYKSRNEKALDKLYCYGEVFDSKILQEFQKEMENILNGGD